MQRERGPSIPHRYLVPHIWDEWLKDRGVHPAYYYPERIQPRPRRASARTNTPQTEKVKAHTVSGKPIEIGLGKGSRYGWDSKYVTQDCPTCPLYVPREDAEVIAQLLLKANGRAQKDIPQDPQGIYLFGSFVGDEKTTIPKFLVPHNSKPPRACNANSSEVEGRALTKRLK